MANRRAQKKRKRDEILNRTIRVHSVALRVSASPKRVRGSVVDVGESSYLTVRGRTVEAIDGICRFNILVSPQEREKADERVAPSVGAILDFKPEILAVIRLDKASFDHLWALANSKQLRYCWLAFTPPLRGSAQIVSASFLNEYEE